MKIRLYYIDGQAYLGIERAGTLYLICHKGRQGDTIQA